MLFVSYEELQKHINHNCNIPSSALDDVVKYEFAFSCEPENADYCRKIGCQDFCHHTLNPEAAKNFDLISDQPTRKKYFENQKSGWIPLKYNDDEKVTHTNFPDELDGSWVLVTDGRRISVERIKKDIPDDHFFPNGRWFELNDAIAWMPLPKPAKVEEVLRDCGNCVHYKLYKENDLWACESWECKFEKKEGDPGVDIPAEEERS